MSNRELNQSQRSAVEYTTGPLLIVAGAGTGKTTVVTQKIAYLIENKLAKPEEILALTFTDNTAAEMQERVDEMLHTGYADIQISTFHSFCQRILEQNALDIGISNQFKLYSETESWLLLRRHIYDLELDYYRPLANPHRHIHELLKHFSKCKDELIMPEDYLKYAESLVLDKDSEQNYDTNEIEIKRLNEIAKVYHKYNQLLLDNNALDFGDLIAYTVKLFETRPNVLSAYQNRYKYILVDEFQDVNWAQYYLVRLLAKNSQLTVVGDDDQSIYAFRGASVSNIMRFKDDFPHTKEIVLNENYRSSQEILDLSYRLIQNNNPDRLEVKLGVNKRLRSKTKNQRSDIEYYQAQNIDEEVNFVMQKICEIHEKQSAVWDDFAILVRANSHTEPFLNALEKANIPYEFLASSGLYRQPIVLDVFNFFKAIADYHESTAIFRLLKLPFLEFKENDLQKLTAFAKKQTISYYETLKIASAIKLSTEAIEKCEKLVNLIHNGMKESRDGKPTTVLYNFLEKSGYLNYLTKEEENGNRKAINSIYHLKQFFDFISRYEESEPDANIHSFVEYFTTILNAGDEGKLYQPTDTPDSVNIMTIHGAKGLEFKYVFVVNLVEERFPSRRRGESIEIPIALVKEQLPEGDFHYQEERRLFYVAITRAKEGLYLTSAESYGGARKKKNSRFIEELGLINPKSKIPNPKQIQNVGFLHDPDYILHDTKAEFIYEIPKKFSYSQIKSYQTCPYQYKLAHILQIKSRGNASFSFGQSIHNTLQKFYQRIRELNSAQQVSLFGLPTETKPLNNQGIKIPELTELLKFYEDSWISEWYTSKQQREDYYQKGKEVLKIFYSTQDGNWTIPLTLESWFKIKIGNYFLHGRIDRVDQNEDKGLEIIDYKTGTAKEKLSSEDKEQLLIYQIAAQTLPEYRNLGVVNKLTFYYINDNIKTSFLGNNKDLDKLIEKISETISSIEKRDFQATPSDFICGHCDFKDICEHRE